MFYSSSDITTVILDLESLMLENIQSLLKSKRPIKISTVSVKIVGTVLSVLLPSMLVYTICRLNGNKQHWEGKGKHGKGKKAFALTVPTIFV